MVWNVETSAQFARRQRACVSFGADGAAGETGCDGKCDGDADHVITTVG